MKKTPREKALDSVNASTAIKENTFNLLRRIDKKDYQQEVIKKILEVGSFTSDYMQDIRDNYNVGRRFDTNVIIILNHDNNIPLGNLKALLDTITFIQMDKNIVNFTYPILKQKNMDKETIKEFLKKPYHSILFPNKLFDSLVKFGIVDESFRNDMYEIFQDDNLLPEEVKDIFLF